MLDELEKDAKNNILWGSIREITLVEQILTKIPHNIHNLLDVGCGDGFLLKYLNKRRVNDYYGIDASSLRLKRTNMNVPFARLTNSDINHIPYQDNSFDVVICSEVLEHVKNYEGALSELIRITKKRLIVTVPNDQELIKIKCPKCDFEHYLSGHINRFNAQSFIKLLKNYKNIKIKKLHSFYTIYSYNKLTLKLPKFMRLLLDMLFNKCQSFIPFLKGNYLILIIEKKI